MIFKETLLKGAFTVEMEKRTDDRGFFARAFCRREFEKRGLNCEVVQANLGFSQSRGILRGLHYQVAPNAETKLVRCTAGAIYDVILDLRPSSSTFKQWIGLELTAENRTMLYIPEGCAHGYLTLADNTEIFYMVTQFYSPEAERGVRWNDPAFDIEWPLTKDLVISDKDRGWPDWLEQRTDDQR